MNTLVATQETQGARPNDFCHAEEGELVMFGFECDREKVDGGCGCRRAFSGTKSAKATTTAKVSEMADRQDWIDAVVLHLTNCWSMADTEAQSYAAEEVDELARIAARFSVGCVVEKRGNTVRERQQSVRVARGR